MPCTKVNAFLFAIHPSRSSNASKYDLFLYMRKLRYHIHGWHKSEFTPVDFEYFHNNFGAFWKNPLIYGDADLVYIILENLDHKNLAFYLCYMKALLENLPAER